MQNILLLLLLLSDENKLLLCSQCVVSCIPSSMDNVRLFNFALFTGEPAPGWKRNKKHAPCQNQFCFFFLCKQRSESLRSFLLIFFSPIKTQRLLSNKRKSNKHTGMQAEYQIFSSLSGVVSWFFFWFLFRFVQKQNKSERLIILVV